MVLVTGVDSPVRLASCALKLEVTQTKRLSAGILSPDSISIKSPGTSSEEERTLCWPDLITLDVGLDNFLSAAKDFSARYSWIKPKIALIITIAIMAKASIHSLRNPETKAAPIKIQTMKS